ncbi:MAG: fibronectin type III domain-containing protein [Patescibacteria group bacterium]
MESMRYFVASFLITMLFLLFTVKYVETGSENVMASLGSQVLKLMQQASVLQQEIFGMKEGEVPAKNPNDRIPPTLANIHHPKNVTTSSATVSWDSFEAGDSLVTFSAVYLRESPCKNTIRDVAITKNHEITLTGLNPNTMYYYTVSSADVNGNRATSNIHTVTTKQIVF